MYIEYILGIKISPPSILFKELNTKNTASSNLVKNLLISKCVRGKSLPWAINSLKKGITEPLDAITFPYLTKLKRVPFGPEREFAFTNNFSAQSLVAPYKFIGLQALSVDRAITFLIPHLIAADIIHCAP